MSGIEVAGLVLAIFPLVVKGVDGYVMGLETYKTWRWYRKEVGNHVRRIKV